MVLDLFFYVSLQITNFLARSFLVCLFVVVVGVVVFRPDSVFYQEVVLP